VISAALFLALFTGPVQAGASDLESSERLDRFKAQYGFDSWGQESGRIISGLTPAETDPPQLEGMRDLRPGDAWAMRPVENHRCAAIRRAWVSPEGRLEVTQVVAPTFDAAKACLIEAYARTSMVSPPVRPGGRTFGLDIGRICFVTPAADGFSGIDFIRHNVLFMLRAEGRMQARLKSMAESLDALLASKEPAASLEEHPERPRIRYFAAEADSLRTGLETVLTLDVRQAPPCGLTYDWTLTGGGVRKDLLDRFIYYGGETGSHQVKVTVINEKGLHDTASLSLSVLP
jgi:hypothetical protein